MSAKSVVLGVAMMWASVSTARADATVTTGAIPGGQVWNYAWDRNTTGKVYASVLGGGLARSTDSGATWTQLYFPTVGVHLPLQILVTSTGALLVCEQYNGPIWRSTDSGATFSLALAQSGNLGGNALAESVASPGTVYAGVLDQLTNPPTGHLYKSSDGGATWTAQSTSLSSAGITDILPLASGRLLIAARAYTTQFGNLAGDGTLYYSDDEGVTLHATTVPGGVGGLAISTSGTIMATTAVGSNNTAVVYTSSDGATWTAVQTLTSQSFPGDRSSHDLVYHAGSDTFFWNTPNGIMGQKLLHSGNAAASYTFGATDLSATLQAPVAYLEGGVTAFAVDPTNALNVIAGGGFGGGGDGSFRSTDGGTTWSVANSGINSQSISIALKERTTMYRYAATPSGFVYFSAGDLATWKTLYRQNKNMWLTALAYDTADPKRVFSGFIDQFTAGNDTLELVPDATTAAADSTPFAHAAWQPVTMPAAGMPVTALLVDGMTMYAGVANNSSTTVGQWLYKSTNGGTSWTPTSLSVPSGVKSLAFDPSNHQVLYAGIGDYLNVSGGLYLDSTPNPGGLWKSSDGGGTWNQLAASTGLVSQFPKTIAIDPNNTQRLWVFSVEAHGTAGGTAPGTHIWESIDAGATFTEITPANIFADALAYSSTSDQLFIAGPPDSNNVNVYGQVPGSGSKVWLDAFGVYGSVDALYNGSVGVGTGTGLFEATNVTLTAPGGRDMFVGGDDAGFGGDAGNPAKGSGGGCCRTSRDDSPLGVAILGTLVALVISGRASRARRGRARA